MFSLVAYHVLNIEDKVSVARLLREVDKAIGFMCVAVAGCVSVFGTLAGTGQIP